MLNLNTIDCTASGVRGTGLAGCKIDRQRVVAMGLLQKGYRFPDNQELDLALIQQLQQEGKLIYLKGITTFVDNTPEANVNTSAGSGLKRVMGKMPYEFLATFENGADFSKALNTLDGHGNYDVIFWDVADVVWMTKTLAGVAKGYSLGMHSVGNYKGSDGDSVIANNTIMLQLTDRQEIDLRMSWVKPEDFGSNDIDGINDVIINIDPIVGNSSIIVFSALLEADNHTPVEGLIATQVLVKVDGTPVTETLTYSAITKKYTATIPEVSNGDVVTIELSDGTYTNILTSLGVLYKSEVAQVIVTA
jgi:hypothetical protein